MGEETTENTIHKIFSIHPDGLLVVSRQNGVIRYLNQKAYELLGLLPGLPHDIQFDYPMPEKPGEELSFFCLSSNRQLSQRWLCEIDWQGDTCAVLSLCEPPLNTTHGKPDSWVENALWQLLNHSHQAVALTNTMGNIIMWNDAAEELLGLKQQDVIEQPLWHIQFRLEAPESRQAGVFERLQSQMSDMLAPGKTDGCRLTSILHIDAAGSLSRDIEATIIPVRSKGGHSLACIYRDVTRTKRLEESLRSSEIRYRTLFNVSPIALWEEDLSKVKEYIDRLQIEGIDDIGSYFEQNPDKLIYCAGLIRYIEINPTALELYEAQDFEEMVSWLQNSHNESTLSLMRHELSALAAGSTFYEGEAVHRSVKCNAMHILLKTNLTPGCEETWSKVFVSATDVTEYRRLETIARENEERYRNLFKESPVAIYEEDLSQVKAYLEGIRASGVSHLEAYFNQHPDEIDVCFSKIIYTGVNHEAIRLFGASSKEELIEKSSEILNESNRQRFKNELIALSGGCNRFEGEASQLSLRGDTIHTVKRVLIPPDRQDTWSMAIVSFMDVTERIRFEEALRLSEERYRAVVESQTELIMRYRADGSVSFANSALCRFVGIEAKDLIGKKIENFIYADDRSKVYNALSTLTPQNPMVIIENRNLGADGEIYWFRWTNYRTFDEQGNFIEHQLVGHEITNRVRMEEALRLSEERYRAVVEGQTELIYRFNPENIITFVNEAFARFVGLDEMSLIGLSRDSLTYCEDQVLVKKMMETLSPENPIAIFENRNINLAGEVRWFRWVNRRFYNEEGEFIEHQSVGHDITERIKAEEKLRRYAERLNILHDIDQAILNLLHPEDVFRVVLGYVADLGFDEYASILVFDQYSNTAERIAISRDGKIRLLSGEERGRKINFKIPPELLSGSTRVVENMHLSEDYRQDYLGILADGMVSYLAVPLFLKGLLSGSLNLAFSKERKYDQETLEVARQVADSLAVAVQNVRLYQADQLARQRTQNLRQATSAISSDLDHAQVLENILIHLEQVVPYKRASIFLKTDRVVRLVAARGFDDPASTIGFEAPLDAHLTCEVLTTQKAIILQDASMDAGFEFWGGSFDTRGWMGVPLIWKQNIIGYLAMDSQEVGAYGEEEAAIAQDFANQAAIAIENARLYEDASRRAREAETLARSATAVTATLDRQQLIERVLEELEQVIPYDSASVLLLDGDALEIIGGRGFDDIDTFLGLRIPMDDNNPEIHIYKTHKPYILDDAPEEYEIFRTQPHIYTRSWLGVPLLYQDRFIGTLALDSLKPGFFNNDHARLAIGFANQVAVALENVRLLEEARQQTGNLRRRDSILQAVSHAAEVFLKSPRWRNSIQNEMKNLAKATDASRAYIYENFLGTSGELMVRQCIRWTDEDNPVETDERFYEGFTYEEIGLARWKKIFQGNQYLCSSIEDVPPDEQNFLKPLGTRFIMVLPIFVQGEWWGNIGFIETQGKRQWTSAEVDAIRAAADILAAAIQHERTQDALLASQKLADLGTLAAGVAHELNSPLQVITGSSEGLMRQIEKMEKIDETRLKHSLEMINRSGWRSAEIIRSLLAYTRSSGGEHEKVSLNELVKDTLLLIEHQLRSWSNISVATDLAKKLPKIQCNRNQITQVLINLLTNARDAMPEGGCITIQTDYIPDSHYVFMKVSDTGTGIPESIRSKIFSPFFTTKPLGQGTGLGLSIVMGIVNSHGGDISVESNPGSGTIFTIYLPVEYSTHEKQEIPDDLHGRYENIL